MAFRIILTLFFSLFLNQLNSKIIYDKDGISINSLEMKEYKKIFFENNNFELSDQAAKKNVILMKKIIRILLKENPEYINEIDTIIKSQNNFETLSDELKLNFMRFSKIRSEFIVNYFQNNFSIKDLEEILSNFNEIKLPISKNNCLTIIRLNNFANNDEFYNGLFKKIQNNSIEIEVNLENQKFDVCLNSQNFKFIESEVIKYIEEKTKDDFNKFIYEKIN